MTSDIKQFFTSIYADRGFKGVTGKDSLSGPGSEGEFAEIKKRFLLDIVWRYEIKKVLDVGCGDFYWMRDIVKIFDTYHGIDIVESVIEENTKNFSDKRVSFECCNILEDGLSLCRHLSWSRPTDLILCFDVFLHLLDDEIHQLLEQLRANSKDWRYLAITNLHECRDTIQPKSRWERINVQYFAPELFTKQPISINQKPVFTFVEQVPIGNEHLYLELWTNSTTKKDGV
jgi:SAM-dependent methyltransferase